MKLNDDEIQAVKRQTQVEPVPTESPAMPELTRIFGDHTFYMDTNGLHVWEMVSQKGATQRLPAPVQIAAWTDDSRTTLQPQEPKVHEVVIDLDHKEGDTTPDAAEGGDKEA